MRGKASEPMPSRTVPIFSNSPANSHMIQCDMLPSRKASGTATATAPTSTCPRLHSQSPSSVTENVSSEFSVDSRMFCTEASRIWPCTVTRNPSMLSRT